MVDLQIHVEDDAVYLQCPVMEEIYGGVCVRLFCWDNTPYKKSIPDAGGLSFMFPMFEDYICYYDGVEYARIEDKELVFKVLEKYHWQDVGRPRTLPDLRTKGH